MAKTHKVTLAEEMEARKFEYAGLCTISQARKAFERGETERVAEWRVSLAAWNEQERIKQEASRARVDALIAARPAFEPVTHQCARCGADVVQSDSEIPPHTLSTSEWLCRDCEAKRVAERKQQMDKDARRVREESARREANDAWERGEN
jgi:DNA-directed RNA polymerase subunit RPC12/RpoP